MSYLNQLSSYLEKSKDEISLKNEKINKSFNTNQVRNPLLTSNNDSLLISNLNNDFKSKYELPLKTANSLKDSTASYLNDSLIYNI